MIGLLDLIVQAYQTQDILVKLSVVEAIPKMGDSSWNSQFVNETLVQKSMLDECFVNFSYIKEKLKHLG